MDRRNFLKRMLVQSLFLIFPKIALPLEIEKEKKKIILTIDDGPRRTMEEILTTLGHEKENPTIFYLVGRNLKSPDLKEFVKKALRKGHIIGNHSYPHPKFSQIDFEKAKREIDMTEEILEKIYLEANVEKATKFFRFPYGDENESAKKYLLSKGYTIQRWDIDSEDWKYYSKKHPFSLDKILENCGKAKEKDIVLLHDLPITSKYLVPFFANSERYELILPN